MDYNHNEAYTWIVKSKPKSIVWGFIWVFVVSALGLYAYYRKTITNNMDRFTVVLLLGFIILLDFAILIAAFGTTIHYNNDKFTEKALVGTKKTYRFSDIRSVSVLENMGLIYHTLEMSNGRKLVVSMKQNGAIAFMNKVNEQLNSRTQIK